MKNELCAGGIIVQKKAGSWYVLLMKDMNNSWTFPKGQIEKDEAPENAAVREIKEEVGLTKLFYAGPLSTVHYTYRRNGVVKKTVRYFLFAAKGNQQPVCQKEEGIKDARWVKYSAATGLIGYPQTNKTLLFKAQKLLGHI